MGGCVGGFPLYGLMRVRVKEAIAATIAAVTEHPHAQDTRPAHRKSILGHESTGTKIRLNSHLEHQLHSVSTPNLHIESNRAGAIIELPVGPTHGHNVKEIVC